MMLRSSLVRWLRERRPRLVLAALVGLAAGALCCWWHVRFPSASNDVSWAIRLIPELLAGRDPYGYAPSVEPMSYPLTAGLITLPLAMFPPLLAAGIFFGLSSALLAYGVTRDAQWWRLLVFVSYPYWMALHTVQWSPLLLAVAFIPALLPITLAKPHIGLPIVARWLNRRRALACFVLGGVSLLLLPDWPLRWLAHQAALSRYILPLAALPAGPLILLALLRRRDRRAQYLVLLAAVPQHRWGYETLLLWSLPATPRQAFVVLGSGWLGAMGLLWGTLVGGVGWGSVLGIAAWYLPSMLYILVSPPSGAAVLPARPLPHVARRSAMPRADAAPDA